MGEFHNLKRVAVWESPFHVFQFDLELEQGCECGNETVHNTVWVHDDSIIVNTVDGTSVMKRIALRSLQDKKSLYTPNSDARSPPP